MPEMTQYELNRYRRGFETCPQAILAKSGHKNFLLFFQRVRATSMTQRRVEKFASTFGRFRLYRLTFIFSISTRRVNSFRNIFRWKETEVRWRGSYRGSGNVGIKEQVPKCVLWGPRIFFEYVYLAGLTKSSSLFAQYSFDCTWDANTQKFWKLQD